ncbi:MAG: hypothetical protein ABIU86_07300 [Gemmatimonadaceae bacterium]
MATSATPAPYLVRGDEVDKRYQLHRQNLERFVNRFSAVLDKEAPDLKQKLLPPAHLPFGYQILPVLQPDAPQTTKQSRVVLSPFSWHRTDSIIDSNRDKLSALEARLDKTSQMSVDDRLREYSAMTGEYRKLVDGQKFIASLVQYNRLWQSEIARLPQAYARARVLQDAALERQSLLDSIPVAGETFKANVQPRLDSLSRMLDSATRKSPTPAYVRVTHPSDHEWIVVVPTYTDITDSVFLEQARTAIEDGWHVRDGTDDFAVKLDIRRMSVSQLYPNGDAPAKGMHMDIAKHVARFPADGAILTSGANTTYVFGRAVLVGPHALPRRILVHEFGHMLGFRDGYFRSYRDQGTDGYQVLEVILPPLEIVATPENGKARRKHFEQMLLEKSR